MPHGLASSLPEPDPDTAGVVSISVVRPDRWFPGNVAVVTSRDGHAGRRQVAGTDVCTGQLAIKLHGS